MPTILNLGCGTRTSPNAINIDWSIYLRLKQTSWGRLFARFALRGERRAGFVALDDSIVVHDLRDGIPAETSTADAVYHSHTLEHIDRNVVPIFMREVLRVLRPGGIHRIVVPDLEYLVRRYVDHLGKGDPVLHDELVAAFIEQCVRREASGTSQQPWLRRGIENRLLGDARARGETHQWMWDEDNLSGVLSESGFVDVQRVTATTSSIEAWDLINLDILSDGRPYKPNSLFIEARKPRIVQRDV